eukprot:10652277-Ditylum_brightwellii.AAC.1
MQHNRCYEVMMKNTGAKCIINTVRFHHHNIVMPKVTHTDRILKATRDLNAAISGIQKTPRKTTNCPCAPNQPAKKSTAKVAEKESAQPAQSTQSPAKEPTPPDIPYVTDDKYLNDGESVNGKGNNNYIVDKPPPPRYNLCMCANDSINSIIFKKTPNVQQTAHDPVHQGRYSIATMMMQIKGTYKSKMYSPIGMLAGALVGDDTGKALEYQDSIHHEKYRKMWTKAFVKELDQLAQGL